jgi:excinuclease UvrABC nuclease subunit
VVTGPLWAHMNAQPRLPAAALRKRDLPPPPGVYAWYRNGGPIYVGKATSLKDRVGRHLGRGKSLTSSALRRNIAQHLGIATAAAIKSGGYRPTQDDVAAVRAFIEDCEVAWVVTATATEALDLETRMKAERRPILTTK